MSHYDCKDCGAYHGIRFGICTACTPAELLQIQKQINLAFVSAGNDWDDMHIEQKRKYCDNAVQHLRDERNRILEEVGKL